jgi:hypothetical protein
MAQINSNSFASSAPCAGSLKRCSRQELQWQRLLELVVAALQVQPMTLQGACL